MKNTKAQKSDVRPISRLSHLQLAHSIVNLFNGFSSLDEKQKGKIGACFASISFRKPMKMRKFHRTEKGENGKKLPNPFLNNVFEVGCIAIKENTIWENVVNNMADRINETGNVGFVANKKRSNGILNFLDSRVVCHKVKEEIETFYLNYVVNHYVGETVYVNGDNETLDYADIAEYHQTKSRASLQKEATKHGLTVEEDVQIRQMKFENITTLSIFGTDFVPFESAEGEAEVVDTKTPQTAQV
jgi:hypothetical protein